MENDTEIRDERRTVLRQIRLSPAEAEKIAADAADHGLTVSAYIRFMLLYDDKN